MKISILSNLFPPSVLGGAELSASFTARELAARGHQVSVLTISDADGMAMEEGMRVRRIRARPFYSPLVSKQKPGWIKPAYHAVDLFNPMMGGQVRRALEEERPDILHCHNIVGFSTAAWQAAAALGIPIVQHLHDFHLVCIKATLMNDKLEACPDRHFPCNYRALHHFSMLGKYVRNVVSPSAFCAQKVFSFDREPNRPWKVSIIPNGTDYAGKPALGVDWHGDRFRILFLGGLFEQKGFNVLREVIETVNRAPNRFEFDIGGAGPLEPVARELAARHPNVRFHGFVGGELKLRLFRESHLFLFPSIWLENNPVTITEALAIGLPCLGSNVGGVPELLAPVSDSLLFPPGSVGAILERLEGFERERARLKGISESLIAKRERYSLARQVDRLLELYAEAAAGR